jgi:hypothetical protein
MSPFFGSPAFISATHDERVRRLRQLGRLRKLRIRDTDGSHGRGAH